MARDITYVRQDMLAPKPAPVSQGTVTGWIRSNLLATPKDVVLTFIAVALLLWTVPGILNWLFIQASWVGSDRSVCATIPQGGIQPEGWSGACWAFVEERFGQFIFGRYPLEERWRPMLVGIMFIALLMPMLIPKVPNKGLSAGLLFVAFPILSVFLLMGGMALPFAAIGFAAWVINLAVWLLAVLVYYIAAAPLGLVNSALWLLSFFTQIDQTGWQLTQGMLEGFAALVSHPLYFLSSSIESVRELTEQGIGSRASFWVDYALTGSVILLIGLRAAGRLSLQTILVVLLFGLFVFFTGIDTDLLTKVETPLWGGLMVTLVLSFVGIAVSLPLGILLALGRRSNLPVIKMLCVTFIEVVRGVPLITVLFMANVMLPLFLPTGWTIDNFLRALVGVALFASAYMAEVIRGGLQAIPKGQYEGADSLGLGYWQTTRLIILPQAIKLVIPGIVNTFIGLFKDTSLVSIIGMFDLLGIVQLNFRDANWITPVTPITGLIFAGFLFWLFCFGMSRYSAFMERHLDTGHKR
ncbi:amino acid ABC transporter permease [Rhizobium sp. RU36D]|uniref:amino acid ABC transporter permease n=1 Tax=Rhizobium sp. RU36D TaxID=1907415 RepID=UPI0009D83EF8|nr:amino acid ABC transporter permease [Rhizobium sp. RU36D]SMC66899.1 general L-amino acid transport system permease protein [Rhizobium sp. RU36D]